MGVLGYFLTFTGFIMRIWYIYVPVCVLLIGGAVLFSKLPYHSHEQHIRYEQLTRIMTIFGVALSGIFALCCLMRIGVALLIVYLATPRAAVL